GAVGQRLAGGMRVEREGIPRRWRGRQILRCGPPDYRGGDLVLLASQVAMGDESPRREEVPATKLQFQQRARREWNARDGATTIPRRLADEHDRRPHAGDMSQVRAQVF